MPFLHDDSHQRGAGRIGHVGITRIPQNLMMRVHQGVREKLRRFAHSGLGFGLELGCHGLEGNLGRHLPFHMPAHAVREHEQGCITGIAIAHAIFVLLATAAAAELEHAEFHACLFCCRTLSHPLPGMLLECADPLKYRPRLCFPPSTARYRTLRYFWE